MIKESSSLNKIGLQSARKIYSISELTADIKRLLENQYPMIWISGEISNLRIPSSGHAYFTLKDKNAQIAAVMFRGQLRQLKFDMHDGMSLVGLGRISVYEPRGTYQIILEYAEPLGIGALQIAFEKLKQKLAEEGLFSPEHKSALPFLPLRPGIITSPTGAVVRDILNISRRRFPNLRMDIYPVSVQGPDAVRQIVAAIQLADRRGCNDVLILARGGGSLEDLAAFNDEQVARAIFGSRLPIVSAVGHETDFSIADFVADVRAPTPSAAAELVIPVKEELKSRCLELRSRAHRATRITLQGSKDKITQLDRRLVHPGKKVQDIRLHLDQLTGRLNRDAEHRLQQLKARFDRISAALIHNSPARRLPLLKSQVDVLSHNILQIINISSFKYHEKLKAAQTTLKAMNPDAILKRGYSITRTLPQGKIIMDAQLVHSGQPLEIQLAKGHLRVTVVEQVNSMHED